MSKVITRGQLIEAIETLDFDPNSIVELHIFPNYVTGTEIVKTLDRAESKRGKVKILPGEAPRRDFHMKVKGEDA